MIKNTLCLIAAGLLLTACASVNTPSPHETETRGKTTSPPHTAPTRRPRAPAATSPGAATDTAAISGEHSGADFWQRLSSGFRLSGKDHTKVKRQVRYYRKHVRLVERTFRQGEPYLAYILEEVEQRNFPAEIVLLPFVESGYDPFAYSHGHAAGLWQFIPGTAKRYGLKQDWWYDGRRDVIASTGAALDYLDRLQRRFKGDWLLALAAYNAGEGTVLKAIKRNRKAGKPTDFWHLDLPRETKAYIPKLLAISTLVEYPDNYGIRLTPLDASPYFSVVDTGHQLDLGIAADLAGMATEDLYLLNPGFNRWATPPDGPHRLAIPAARTGVFAEKLAGLPAGERVKWTHHTVGRGDTLSQIANRYGTTVTVLRHTNGMRNTTIRTGSKLVIPLAAHDPSHYAILERVKGTPGGRLDYRVRSGDNLWTIARRHQVKVSQIAKWNGLNPDKTLKPGQKLVIWQSGKSDNRGKSVHSINYTVRKGDSLYLISRKFNVSVNQLRQWNGLAKNKYLQPGQKLKLYVDAAT